ncbi:armadillo-type protein [Phascolomyces articulosus]|uniref:Armadillo-type protein n=1 Tax=Phascolomyces articulosus TaxID=60185 RepID=A0AAD5JNS9_9FUNG|nr:armadillo-type protein [Phascolomyces articulosus]
MLTSSTATTSINTTSEEAILTMTHSNNNNTKWQQQQPVIQQQQHQSSVMMDNDMPLFPLPPASSSLKSRQSFGSSSLDDLDYFGRLTTRLPTPPSAFPGNVADHGSSGTPSPKEEGYDLKHVGSFDYFDPFYSPLMNKDTVTTTTTTMSNNNKLWRDDFLYNHHQQQQPSSLNMIPTATVFDTNIHNNNNKEQQEGQALPNTHMTRTIATLLSMSMSTMNTMSSDNLRHHLCNAIDVIHNLVKSFDTTQAEFDKKCHQVWSLQSCLSSKEREVQNIKQQLMVVTQLCDAQANQLCQQQQQQQKKNISGLNNNNNKQDHVITEKMISSIDSQQQQNTTLRQTKSLRNLHDTKTDGKIMPSTITAAATTTGPLTVTTTIATSEKGSHGNNRRRASAEKHTSNNNNGGGNNNNSNGRAHHHHHPTQNAEYRRKLVDKNAPVDWEAMIDKIIQRGDQQASLFLQQKLKAATTKEQKQVIFESILPQAYPLMTSRFGNFLVQRLFEVGTPEQVSALITKMQGRIVSLTCQPFGCHVLQKAFDCCPDETTRASMVEELFENISDTITHKHACHIWQKVFEMQWTQQDVAPPVMARVNQALQGKWTQVALDETGSLVIQHIFENVCEQEKRPVLDEVLDNIMVIARGQWGNWVVQHILEQAQECRDREHAFSVVLEHAAGLSMDQFASKVVEKALRTGGPVFLEQFMEKIMCKQNAQQRREPLMDMASDQYGNYVVQWLINHAGAEHQVKMCRLIKRHMVSLRGSKYGQRVAFLVEKVLRSQEITTYPGANTTATTISATSSH